MWKSNKDRLGREPDFKIRYRFISHSDGGRVQLPYQGHRSDFCYEGEDPQVDGVYMIWPEFLNADGSVMLEDQMMVAPEGEAYMWILNFDEMKEHHRARAIPGKQGWLVEGTKKVAEVTVIEQIRLLE